MRFTVVTPSYNCADYILRNIRSVREQGLAPGELEHWIIDGGSTDGTVELLRNQAGIKWISEKDRGLSDAVNKGIQRARGQWIVWLNADDSLALGALDTVSKASETHPEVRLFCGAVSILRYDGSLEQTVPGWDYNLKDLLGTRTGINQPSTIVHREVYDKVGLLNVEDRYAMDYEWVVRAMHHYRCQPLAETLAFAHRRRGSITDANMVRQFQRFLEIRRQYHQPVLSRAEFRIRFYIYTEGLRRIGLARRAVRFVKRQLGREPLHPM